MTFVTDKHRIETLDVLLEGKDFIRAVFLACGSLQLDQPAARAIDRVASAALDRIERAAEILQGLAADLEGQ